MDDLVYRRFTVAGKVEDCAQTPTDPAKDACKVAVEEATSGLNFTMERHGDAFQAAASDLPKIKKSFPSFSPPVQSLLDYLAIKAEVFKIFGTEENPSEITKKISIGAAASGESVKATFMYTEALANFVSHGSLDPKTESMKQFLASTIEVGARSFADPALGNRIAQMFKELESASKLGSESRTRIRWLLGSYEVREKLWGPMKPEFDKSVILEKKLKSSSIDILTFLLANHVLNDGINKERIFSERIKEAANTYNDLMLQRDPSFHPSKNFYTYLKVILPKLKEANLPTEYRKDFLQRLDLIVNEYDKAAEPEMFRLMEKAPVEKSCKDFLLYQYGDTPARWAALEIVLKETSIVGEENGPHFILPMAKISQNLKDWVASQPSSEKKKEAIEAINHLLKALFERDGKMKVYWNKQTIELDNFYSRGDFGLVGPNKSALEDLIRWAHDSANTENMALSPDSQPHQPLRKITLGIELGVGAIGFGTYFGGYAMKEGEARYYLQGTALIAGGIGLGMAAGNTLSYLLNMSGKGFWIDVAGGVLGGLIAGSIYFATVKKPPNLPPGVECIGNCTKYPTDVYGQSLPMPLGVSFQGGF